MDIDTIFTVWLSPSIVAIIFFLDQIHSTMPSEITFVRMVDL
jgi:hypothetical protein